MENNFGKWDETQVITDIDIHRVYEGFKVQYYESRWWQFGHRWQLRVALRVMSQLHDWVAVGKPSVRVLPRQEGNHHEF